MIVTDPVHQFHTHTLGVQGNAVPETDNKQRICEHQEGHLQSTTHCDSCMYFAGDATKSILTDERIQPFIIVTLHTVHAHTHRRVEMRADTTVFCYWQLRRPV